MNQSYKNRLFELISKEDVVLFAGAGLSLYAGYPSGYELRDIFWKRLNESEKQNFDKNLQLSILTQNIFDLHSSRNSLISTLRDVFLIKPKKNKTHQIISKIPHFKTIITTNYDRLFEDVFKENGQVILGNNDLPYIENNKTQIYKIHGDLSKPETIILTESDYNNFFKKNSEQEPFWNSVKEKIATKTILFVGYSLDDSNIKIIFDKILESIGVDLKERFFIAPNLQQFNIDKLSRKGIKYINTTGEKFFSEALNYLNNNTFIDLEKGIVSAETIKKFASNFGYNLKMETNVAGFYLQDINNRKKEVQHKVNFTIKNDDEIVEKFNDFISGKSTENLVLKKDELLNFDVWADKFRIKNFDNISEFTIKKLPSFKGDIDIIFDDGFEIDNFTVEFYISDFSENERKIFIKNKNVYLRVKLYFKEKGIEISFSIEPNEIITDVSSILKFYLGVKRISQGTGFSVIKDGVRIFSQEPVQKKQSSKISFYIEYFESLKKIEKFYKIKFKNFKSEKITDLSLETIRKVISKIENNFYFTQFLPLTASLSDNFDKGGISINDNNEMVLMYRLNDCEEVEIHNQKFILGYKDVIIMEPEIEYFKDSLGVRKMKIKSKSKQMKFFYRDKYEPLEQQLESD